MTIQVNLLFLVTLLLFANGFNIITQLDNVQVLQHSYNDAMNTTNGTSATYNFTMTFFGYKLDILKSNSSERLYVGAPKAYRPQPSQQPSSADANGDILSCSLSEIFSAPESMLSSCTSVDPLPGSQLSDSAGQNFEVEPNGTLRACAYKRPQSCRGNVFTPGHCYTKSIAGTWAPDPYTRDAQLCPEVDFIIVLDSSFSIGLENFDMVKNWTKEVVRLFDISQGKTRVGVNTFSGDFNCVGESIVRTWITLGQFTNQTDFKNAVNNITYINPVATCTATALNYTAPQFSDGNRRKVIILLTDGVSSESAELPITAKYVRSLGIFTFAVGVDAARISELQIIATGRNTSERVYFTSDFGALLNISEELFMDLSSIALEGFESTSVNFRDAQYGFSIQVDQVCEMILLATF
ncbi:vitrin-like isoform X1 [Clavelina lepadiformis]|uniref:vitrin-like isoform X1 n=1 Tax=Clavelina lepadiformis TaxID=159417 RepID=UPI0040410337